MSIDQPNTLDQRLRAVRGRRKAFRRANATTLLIWTAGLTALLVVVSAGLLTFH